MKSSSTIRNQSRIELNNEIIKDFYTGQYTIDELSEKHKKSGSSISKIIQTKLQEKFEKRQLKTKKQTS